MKVIFVCFLRLDEIPPVMANLKVLSEEHEVLYIGIDGCTERYRDMFGRNVRFVNLLEGRKPYGKRRNKLSAYLYWKRYYFFLRKAYAVITRNYKPGDLVWVHHEFTLMHFRRLELPYHLTMYELPDGLFKPECELKKRVRLAQKVVVPEYSRAAIVQACTGLKELPAVIPNKPYDYGEDMEALDDNPMEAIARDAHAQGKRVVLYSGIFLRERKLDTILEAVRKLSDKFVIVLVGGESEYLRELLNQYPEAAYLGFYPPPSHMPVIEKADIGILTYVADNGSINAVFCAPNKVWEYARYGMPMICNDIPGLKYTVEYNNFGFCCDINSVESICGALNRIDERYEELSENARGFYETVDIREEILKLV